MVSKELKPILTGRTPPKVANHFQRLDKWEPRYSLANMKSFNLNAGPTQLAFIRGILNLEDDLGNGLNIY